MTINKTRLKILAQLEKKAMRDKIASDAVEDVNNAGIEDPQEYANRIFDQLLNNLDIHIDGLDDNGEG